MQRNGFPYKAVILGVFLLGTVYLLYLYNSSLGRLRDTELTAERYRRAEDSKTSQLQEVLRAKDELRDRLTAEKHQLSTRLENLNDEYMSYKSRFEDLSTERQRLQQELRRSKEECSQTEARHNQEYQQLKQEKDLELSNLKDEIANVHRRNEEVESENRNANTALTQCQNKIAFENSLRRNLEEDVRSLQQQLADRDREMIAHYQQQKQQQQHQKQQQRQPAGSQNSNFINQLDNNGQAKEQRQGFNVPAHKQPMGAAAFGSHDGVDNMNIEPQQGGDLANAVPGAGQWGHRDSAGAQDVLANLAQQQQQQQLQQQQQDLNNEQHQVLPPHNVDQLGAHDDGHVRDDRRTGAQQAQPKDEEHQVMPPDFNVNANVPDRRRGMGQGDHQEEEEEEEEEDQGQNEDPLGLKQVVAPNLGDQALNDGGQGGQAKEDIDDVFQNRAVDKKQHGGDAAEEEEEDDKGDDDEYEDNNDVGNLPLRHNDDDNVDENINDGAGNQLYHRQVAGDIH